MLTREPFFSPTGLQNYRDGRIRSQNTIFDVDESPVSGVGTTIAQEQTAAHTSECYRNYRRFCDNVGSLGEFDVTAISRKKKEKKKKTCKIILPKFSLNSTPLLNISCNIPDIELLACKGKYNFSYIQSSSGRFTRQCNNSHTRGLVHDFPVPFHLSYLYKSMFQTHTHTHRTREKFVLTSTALHSQFASPKCFRDFGKPDSSPATIFTRDSVANHQRIVPGALPAGVVQRAKSPAARRM